MKSLSLLFLSLLFAGLGILSGAGVTGSVSGLPAAPITVEAVAGAVYG